MKKINLKRFLPFIIIIFGIVIFAGLIITQPSSLPVPHKERVWKIQTVLASPQSHSPSLTLYGQIETPALINAAAPKNSRVTSILVREGDSINKGQLLLSLDERDFKPQLAQTKAKVAELNALIQSEKFRYKADKTAFSHEKSILKLEQSAVQRAKMLKNKNLGSTAALEQAQEDLDRQRLALTNRKLALDDHTARLQQLKARLTHAEADVELAQLDFERSQIIAPFNGFIEKLSVAAGDQVKENQILITFYSTDQLEIRAKIPSAFQGEIQKALFNKQPLIAKADYTGLPLELSLNRLSGIADTRGIDALFDITSGSQWLRPGSSISLSLLRPNQDNLIVLPYSALYDNNRIYRVVKNRLQAIIVQIVGNYLEGDTEKLLVFSHKIHKGDELLITHLPNAINGLKVKSAHKK
jgi:RND family efflux transporter MFP subunit